MTGTLDRVEVLANALDQVHTLIERIEPDRRDAPTPCASWTVTDLVEHLIADLGPFTAMAGGGGFAPDESRRTAAPEDWGTTFATGAQALLAAWRKAGPGDAIDLHIAEMALHAWDLDVATGRHLALDPLLAQVGLGWMRASLTDDYRGSEADGKSFGPEVPAPEGAGPYEQLAAFAGRHPATAD